MSSWSSTARTGSCSTSSRCRVCSRTTVASGSNSCATSSGARMTRPYLANAVFDGHLCVAEYLLYGPVPYSEVLALADSLRATATRAGRPAGGRIRSRARGRSRLARRRSDPSRARAAGSRRPAPRDQRVGRRSTLAAAHGRTARGPGSQRRGTRPAATSAPARALVVDHPAPPATDLRNDDPRRLLPRGGTRRRRDRRRGARPGRLLHVLPGDVRGSRDDRLRRCRRSRRPRRRTTPSPSSRRGCGTGPRGRPRRSRRAPTSPRHATIRGTASRSARPGGARVRRRGPTHRRGAVPFRPPRRVASDRWRSA